MRIQTLLSVSLVGVLVITAAGCTAQNMEHGEHADGDRRSSMPMTHQRQQGDHHGEQHGQHPAMHDNQQMGQGMGMPMNDPFAASMAAMMRDMHGMVLSGDVDYDFVAGMIPHHQGAIDMAKVQLELGQDATLHALSRDIIAAQEEEIAFMRDWLATYGEPRPGNNQEAIRTAYDRINQAMMRDMHVPPTGNVDRDFVRGMIPHHQAAVDMAEVILAHSTRAELRSMAEDVIREQRREIAEMEAWLVQN